MTREDVKTKRSEVLTTPITGGPVKERTAPASRVSLVDLNSSGLNIETPVSCDNSPAHIGIVSQSRGFLNLSNMLPGTEPSLYLEIIEAHPLITVPGSASLSLFMSQIMQQIAKGLNYFPEAAA